MVPLPPLEFDEREPRPGGQGRTAAVGRGTRPSMITRDDLMPTALIVEDEPEANHLLAMLVQLRGYQTSSAYTGNEALEKVRDDPPDIVFLDLMLPDINGYDVCRSLKTKKATSLIPVVMVTARVAAENRLQSFHVGADDYIPKPYTPDQIFQAMDDADAWRRSVEQQGAEGEVRLGISDDGETLRQLAQLRNLLVGRTPLDLEAIRRIGAALKTIQESADAWRHTHQSPLGASLAYRLDEERLTLTLHDPKTWLAALTREESWWKWVMPPFDEVSLEDNDHRLVLEKRFASTDGVADSHA
jgi:CheY-like chemotaxis protein